MYTASPRQISTQKTLMQPTATNATQTRRIWQLAGRNTSRLGESAPPVSCNQRQLRLILLSPRTSKLRKKGEAVYDAKYEGKKGSRKELYGADEDEEESEDDEDLESDEEMDDFEDLAGGSLPFRRLRREKTMMTKRQSPCHRRLPSLPSQKKLALGKRAPLPRSRTSER